MSVLSLCIYCVVFCVLIDTMTGAENTHRNTTINTYKMHEQCGGTINMKWKSIYTAEVTFDLDPSHQVLPSHEATGQDDKYTVPVMCELTIVSWDFLDRLMVVFQELKIETDCGATSLEVLEGPEPDSPPLKGLPTSLCEHHVSRIVSVPYTTSDKQLTIRVHGNTDRKHKLQFTFIVVAFHEGTCMSYQHTCPSGRCIMDDIVCNGHNPCGDFSDCPVETSAPREVNTEERDALVVALAAISATIVALIVGVLVFCYFYRRRRKHLRQQLYRSALGRADNELQISVAAQLERSVSQIEAERRLAPPSYSTLEPTPERNQSESESELSVENENEDQSGEDSCLEPDDNNPPSYACVMSHQDEFKISDLELNRSRSPSIKDT